MKPHNRLKLVPTLDGGCNLVDVFGKIIDSSTLLSMLREKPTIKEPTTSFLTTNVPEPQGLKGARPLVYDVAPNYLVIKVYPDGARLLREAVRYTGRL